MKILLCSPNILSKELGAPKVLIELAEELEKLGWNCRIISPSDLDPIQSSRSKTHSTYAEMLRQYLSKYSADFDVVEYDHGHLPYLRKEFSEKTLFVARSVLLGHHFQTINIPVNKSIKSIIRSYLFSKNDIKQRDINTKKAHLTVSEADLVNVVNEDDKKELIKWGISAQKIVVLPNGISQSRRPLFDAVSSTPPLEPKVVFIGTFDNRKGATDFPAILQNIYNQIPTVTFRLLGTSRSREEIIHHFPRTIRDRIEVIPKFLDKDLPNLLNTCSVGIFPSYIEGFGLGVLEMLAASIPVIAYNSPGPPMMLPPEYLVSPGDTESMSKKVVSLLNDRQKLMTARICAKERSQKFCWQQIAKETSDIYLKQWQKKQL